MSIEHKDITEANLHEPKGVSAANNGEVYIANGTGGGAWDQWAAHGGVYFVNLATPSVLVTPTSYTKVAPTTIATGHPTQVTEATTARLTYTGARARNAFVTANVTVDQTAGASRPVNLAIYKNGVIVAASEIQTQLTTADKMNISLHIEEAIATNDYFEVYAKITGTGNLQFSTLNLLLLSV